MLNQDGTDCRDALHASGSCYASRKGEKTLEREEKTLERKRDARKGERRMQCVSTLTSTYTLPFL